MATSVGFTLEMYTEEDMADARLEILSGEVQLSLENGSIYQLKHGHAVSVFTTDYLLTASSLLTLASA